MVNSYLPFSQTLLAYLKVSHTALLRVGPTLDFYLAVIVVVVNVSERSGIRSVFDSRQHCYR